MPLPTILDGLTPSDLGMPEKFEEYRPIQGEIAEFGLYGTRQGKRSAWCGAPTGSGKSLAAETMGVLSGVKYAILTATRGLEDQVVDDGFEVVNVRGRANYPCKDKFPMAGGKKFNCDEGEDHGCQFAGTRNCTYGELVEEAKTADGTLHNYQYWMHARGRNRTALETPVRPIELLIMDEVHLAPQELSRFLGVWISRDNLQHFSTPNKLRDLMHGSGHGLGHDGKDWAVVGKDWVAELGSIRFAIKHRMGVIEGEHEDRAALARRQSREYRELEKLVGDVERVSLLGSDGNWIWHPTKAGVKFDCVWPFRYAEQYLFSGVERLVGLSATLRPKCMSLMGVGKKDYDYKEWPRVFPQHLSPVYYWPLGRMGKNAKDEDVEAVCQGVDELFEARPGVHTIIHTVSYDRAEMLQARCKRAGRYMVLSKPGEAATAAKQFREMKGTSGLCSPSYSTGWDFPNEECQMIIVPKLPFSAKGDPVVQARESDPSYENYVVMQAVVQSLGRGTRHKDDRCESFILDKAWGWFQWAAKEHAPMSFKSVEVKGIPGKRW